MTLGSALRMDRRAACSLVPTDSLTTVGSTSGPPHARKDSVSATPGNIFDSSMEGSSPRNGNSSCSNYSGTSCLWVDGCLGRFLLLQALRAHPGRAWIKRRDEESLEDRVPAGSPAHPRRGLRGRH